MKTLAAAYNRVLRFARPPTVEEIHPALRYTRLGAFLREHGRADDTVGQLSRAILSDSPHEHPLELTPLHALRDEMLDTPNHPLAKAFNWETLPESVELDQRVRRAIAEEGRNWGVGDLSPADILLPRTRLATGGPRYNAVMSVRSSHKDIAGRDLHNSLHRLNDQDYHRLATAQYITSGAGATAANEATHQNLLAPLTEYNDHQRY